MDRKTFLDKYRPAWLPREQMEQDLDQLIRQEAKRMLMAAAEGMVTPKSKVFAEVVLSQPITASDLAGFSCSTGKS